MSHVESEFECSVHNPLSSLHALFSAELSHMGIAPRHRIFILREQNLADCALPTFRIVNNLQSPVVRQH
eukprot:scaffold189582_cov15-Prasinocladus_malaysianus.AAC.1